VSTQTPEAAPPTPAPAEDEATAAALAHLRALEDADRFAAAVPAPAAGAAASPERAVSALDYTAPVALQQMYSTPDLLADVQPLSGGGIAGDGPEDAEAPKLPTPPRGIRNIEDIYALYPVGDGQTFLRVQRTQPKVWQGVPVAGFLCDLNAQVSMEEFTQRFGGHCYEIHVIGPAPRRMPSGDLSRRTLTTFELRVPGPPVFAQPDPYAFEEFSMQPARPGYAPRGLPSYFTPPVAQPMIPESVQLEELKSRERERERAEQERLRLMESARAPDEVVRAATQAAREAVEIARSGADDRVGILREQITSLVQQLTAAQDENRRMRDEIVRAERAASEARQATETEQIKRLTESHARELSRINDEHARDMARVLQESRDKLADESRRHVEERAKVDSDIIRERQRMQEDFDRRDRDARLQADLIRQQMKEQYESRLADLERRTSEQIQAVKEQRDREVESARQSEKAQATVVRETSGFQVQHLQTRNVELMGENERLKRENEALRRQSVKDPLTYLTEVRTTARDLLGMVDAEEVDKGPAPPAATNWGDMAGKAVFGLIDKLPQVVQEVGQLRNQAMLHQQHQQAQQQALAQQAQQQALAQQQGVTRAPALLPAAPPPPGAPPEQTRRRNLMGAPPPWAAPSPPGAPVGMPPAFAGPIASGGFGPLTPNVPGIVSGLPVAPAVPPVAGVSASVSPVVSPVQPDAPPVPPAPPATPSAPAAQPPAPAAGAPVQIQQEQVTIFIRALNEHIAQGTPVELFARGFVSQVGRDVASTLLASITPDQLIEAIGSSPDGDSSYILTTSGREFVTRLWPAALSACKEP